MDPTRITRRDRRIMALWLAGETKPRIAELAGTSPRAVARCVERLGLPPRMTGARPLPEQSNLFPCIVAWARQGYSAEEIARGVGCTKPDQVARIS